MKRRELIKASAAATRPGIECLIKTVETALRAIQNFFVSVIGTSAHPWSSRLASMNDALEGAKGSYTQVLDWTEAQAGAGNSVVQSLQSKLLMQLSDVNSLVAELVPQLGNFVANLQSDARDEKIYKSMFATIPLPDIANTFHDDEEFANLRLAGANAMLLKGVARLPEKFPLTDAQYQRVMGPDDTLDSAAKLNRLYLLDYADLGSVATSGLRSKPLTGTGYSYAPIALFALTKDRSVLVPVAIQCDQDPAKNPIFLRAMSNSAPEYWAWQMAKTVVSGADENYHELFVHLGRTHLLLEAFCIATHRNLAPTHPLYALLIPHFEGTLFINDKAASTLLAPSNFIDTMFAAALADVGSMTLKDRLAFDFYENMFPNDIVRRNVGKSRLPYYPYRDDGGDVWNAIYTWAFDYVSVYYLSDQDVINDYELEQWRVDVLNNGAVKGFIPIGTRAQLVAVLTMIIFTASAQHAAANFPQPVVMSYAPAVSALLSVPAPREVGTASEATWDQSRIPASTNI